MNSDDKSIGSAFTSFVNADPIPVVCARWCPTLPHPGGCSTIGAVRLSFRVRDGAGRFPVAVTTETTVGSAVPSRVADSVVWLPFVTAHPGVDGWWLRGWVGCGPYSGRFALTVLPHVPFAPLPAVLAAGGWVGVGGCCLCRPISTSQLPTVTGLPLLAYQPSSLLGAYQDTEVSCGDLILKMVSRLDAFSGYPSRT